MLSVEDIARVCHDVNRSYQAAFGDMSVPLWEHESEFVRKAFVSDVKFRLAHAFAPVSVKHEHWRKKQEAAGWTYGPVTNHARKEHPCLLPFDELHKDYQVKDFLFAAVVDSLAGKLETVQNGKAFDEDRMGQSD